MRPTGSASTDGHERRGSSTAVMVQTLGDKLDESMRIKVHSSEEVAQQMGVTTSEVLLWKHGM